MIEEVWAPPPDVSFAGGISADGRYVSYVDWAAGNLGVRDLAEETSSLLTRNSSWSETGGTAYRSAISRDGRWIAYNWEHQGPKIFYDLRVVGRDGGNQRVLFSDPEVFWILPLGWSPDGNDILAWLWRPELRLGQLAFVEFADGTTRVLRQWDGRSGLGNACLSPDGRFVAFDFEQEDVPGHHDIFLVGTDGVEFPSCGIRATTDCSAGHPAERSSSRATAPSGLLCGSSTSKTVAPARRHGVSIASGLSRANRLA